MRRTLAVFLVLAAPAIGCSKPGACDAAGDELIEANELLDEDPSPENFAAAQAANAEWHRLACDNP